MLVGLLLESTAALGQGESVQGCVLAGVGLFLNPYTPAAPGHKWNGTALRALFGKPALCMSMFIQTQ